MPRTLVRAPDHDRSRSLGWLALAWMEFFVVHGPGDVQGQPVRHGDEFSGFVADCYALELSGRLQYDSAFFSRPKGCDKSGLGARLGLFEALGPCRFAGWAEGGEVYEDPWSLGFRYVYEAGEPMGRHVQTPYIRIMATEEGQTGNVYDTIHFNLTDEDAPLAAVTVDSGLTRVFLPGGGEITPSTASSASKDGGKETFVVFDEPMALDTPIPTPAGWRTMGDLRVGDFVLGVDGKPLLVWGVAPVKHSRPCFRVTFDDGTSVITDATHRWHVFDRISTKRWAEWTTGQMSDANWYGKMRFAVTQPEPFDLDVADLPLDPYVLGLWLGDGDSRVATLAVGRDDLADVLHGLHGLTDSGFETTVYDYDPDKGAVSVRFNHGQRYGKRGTSQAALRTLGVLGNKHVPDLYLWASKDQRLALLQGLMDSDGHVNERGNCVFTNTSRKLADAVVHLARSLGWRASTGNWHSDERWKARTTGTWRVSFTPSGSAPFRLKRKVSRCRTTPTSLLRGIRSIEPVESVPVRCIAVDSDDHLFLAGEGMLPTHNTHLYDQPELRRMYATVTRNMRKRKRNAGTWFLETTTMFAPGSESVAEGTYDLAEKLQEIDEVGGKRYKALRHRLLFDHRWGECADLADEAALRAAILEAFGEAIEWNDIESILDEFHDPRKATADSRRYFLNARTSASDAWLAPHEWGAEDVADATKSLADQDTVTLGFDGSVRDDSTALVACRVHDGHLELLGCWEKPDEPGNDGWQVDRVAVDAAVAAAFDRFRVVGFYADPAFWADALDRWMQEFGRRLRVKASQPRPIEWWTNRPKHMVDALQRFHDAVLGKQLSHDGGTTLTRHVLNARRRVGRVGVTIAKEFPSSSRKIDGAMAAVLAYECRGDAVAQGLGRSPRRRRTRRAHGF